MESYDVLEGRISLIYMRVNKCLTISMLKFSYATNLSENTLNYS